MSEQRRLMIDDFKIGRAILAMRGRRDFAAEGLRQEMLPVADAEDRHVRIDHVGGQRRRAVVVDAVRTAGENEGLRLERHHPIGRGVPRKNLAIDVGFAHAPRDELRVL